MTVETMPDVEGGVRAFLRADPDVAALVGNRVFFGVPTSTVFPLVTVSRVGGGDDPSEAAVDLAVLTVQCWGEMRDKAGAYLLANTVRSALRNVRGRTQFADDCWCHGATVDGLFYSPDPTQDRPRYVLTIRVTATAT